MGNHPSTAAKQASSASQSPSGTPSPSSHEPTRAISTRRDHPRNLIQSHRTGAAAEPSLAQARGTTASHRARYSQSFPVSYLNNSSPSQGQSQSQGPSSPASHSGDLQTGGSYQAKPEEKPVVRDQPSKPVAVPIPSSNNDHSSIRSHSHSIEPSGPSAMQDMSYHITRPPRLPLPIEEEVHTPGSPIVAATDLEDPVLDIGLLDNDELPRQTSGLSNTTIEEEEDAEELNVDKSGLTVPTPFEWRKGGAKVYVTGTIFQWNKKHRLHPVEGQPGLLRAIIHCRPGTHHIRFIVDSIMQCSPDLPTTVDFGNNLVNYIEVSPDDLPRDVPVDEDGVGIAEGGNNAIVEPATTESKAAEDKAKGVKPAPKTKPILPPHRYISEIPQYLIDLDKPEDSPEYQYAAAAIEKLPTPPSLPGFLGKPILNAATPMKDDNSVLIMPNHTVLNHLATSSIKNNILAVSATTRYKRKYVTTIMYKPSGSG